MPEPFRIIPKAPAEAFKTYEVAQPTRTHTRPGTCAEVNCANRERGWKTVVDVSTELGKKQAQYIRMHSGRAYSHTQAGTIVTFVFSPGQTCFSEHRVSLQREPLFRIIGGDWRGNPLGLPTQRLRPADWLDSFGEHQLSIKTAREKG